MTIDPSITTTATASHTRVFLIGVGGASCSGKTTLLKHLHSIIPNSVILHQDDFTLPWNLIPFHPIHNIRDWDDPDGAIEWSRMVQVVQQVKRTGKIPQSHESHDRLNIGNKVPVSVDTIQRLRKRFEAIQEQFSQNGEDITWGLIDGYLLYWHPHVVAQLDVKLFLRLPYEVLKERRDRRREYFTADGSLWRDPVGYWENIVWPAYCKAHVGLFENGNLETGQPLVVSRNESFNGYMMHSASSNGYMKTVSSNEDHSGAVSTEVNGTPVPGREQLDEEDKKYFGQAVPDLYLVDGTEIGLDEVLEKVTTKILAELLK